MAPGTGAIEKAKFGGATRFEDGALRAAAADGDYQVDKGVLALTGKDGPNDPQVQTDRLTVTATRIDLTLRRHQAAGRRRGAQRAQAGAEGRRPESARRKTSRDVQGGSARVRDRRQDGLRRRPVDRDLHRATPGSGRPTRRSRAPRSSSTTRPGDLKASGQAPSTFTVLEQVTRRRTRPTKRAVDRDRGRHHYEDARAARLTPPTRT